MGIIEFKKDKFMQWIKKESNWDNLSLKTKNAFSEWSAQDPQAVFSKINGIINVSEEIVVLIEKFAKTVDNLSNKEKLDLAVELIDDLLELPRLLEWADNIIIRYILSTIVQTKNQYLGKDWFKDDE